MTWHLATTAPVGEDVLVFCPDADTPVMICHRFEDEDEWYEQNPSIPSPLDVEVTHWMPLPTGPAQ
jgi:hypothetical protein